MDNDKIIKKLDGANMDIDLSTDEKDISWKRDKCPWNEAAKNTNQNIPPLELPTSSRVAPPGK